MADKRMTADEVVSELRSGMTIGFGGWGSRRKPMSLVRALLRSNVSNLTVVSYGGPDVGLLVAAGKVRKLVYGFVSLDSIPLEPHFQQARQNGSIEATEWDEGMIRLGLSAAASRVPFLPTRAGLGSDVMTIDPRLRTVASPYGDEELLAVPALNLDAALVHQNRADRSGNAQVLGRDPYFDELFCMAAERAYVSCEKIIETAEFASSGPIESLRLSRWMVDGVVEAPNGAHFTSCDGDYARDEAFQREYVDASRDPDLWQGFVDRYLAGTETDYQDAVSQRARATA